jgi:hypothetical protein
MQQYRLISIACDMMSHPLKTRATPTSSGI